MRLCAYEPVICVRRALTTSSSIANSSSVFTPEQTDAAIREMNAEMEELFGSHNGSCLDGGMMSSAMPKLEPSLHVEHLLPQKDNVEQGMPFAPAQSVARAALAKKITWCAAELSGTQDIERATKLASCIAECARAAAALK